MIQLARSPYLGVSLPGTTATAPGTPVVATTTSSSSTAPSSSGLVETPWYKRPPIIVGGLVGLAALGGLAWWAFK